MMSAWKIYYDDGSSVSGNTLNEWRAARQDGVVAVVKEEQARGRQVWHGREFYVRLPDGGSTDVYGVDDLMGLVKRYLPWIKVGTLVPDQLYRETLNDARHCDGFCAKSPRSRKAD